MDNLSKTKKEVTKDKGSRTLLATPSNIRVHSSVHERLRRLIITFAYALFVGLGIYEIQSFSFNDGAQLAKTAAVFYKAVAFVFAIIVVSLNAFYIYYSAKVQGRTTWKRTAKHLVNAIIPLLGIILLALGVIGGVQKDEIIPGTTFNSGASVTSGTNIFIYISAVGIILSAGWTFVENLILRQKFPNAFKIARNLLPGILVAIGGMIIVTTKTSAMVPAWMDIIVPMLVTIAGGVMMFFAAALSFRTSDYGNKLKKLIKYGYVSHLIVTFTVLTCFLFSQTNISLVFKDSAAIIILIVQVIATVAMITYIIVVSRNKKNLQSNPIHNRIMLMSYLGLVNVLGLMAVFTSPHQLTTVVDKSQFAFTFLGLSSLLSLLTMLVASAMAFMTIEFKGYTALAMAAIQLILILFLTMVVFTEKDVAVVTNLMGRFVVLLAYSSTLVVYLLFEAYWIIYLFLGEKSDKKQLKRAKEALEAKEKQEEGQNA